MRRAPRPHRSLGRPSLDSRRSGCPVQAPLGRGSFAQRLLEQLSDKVITHSAGNNLVPFQNASRVSVHNKNWVIAGIQQNRVGGLRPYTIDGEQFVAELGGWLREHPLERSAVTLIEKAHKRFQPLRFLPKVTRRANQLLKLRLRRAPDSADGQKPRSPKVAERPLNVRPRSVLRQVGPNNYLEPRLRRPP